MTIGVLAIVAVRNEEVHMPGLLSRLCGEGFDVVLIDNGSTDATREIAESYRGQGVIDIVDQPWEGVFSLSNQLDLKADIIDNHLHDWIVHTDADEWLQSPVEGESLLQGINKADETGANCINFNEFVFVPRPGENFYSPDYIERMRHYYFFQPYYPRLTRAWKRKAGFRNTPQAGHLLEGPNQRRYAVDFNLRHYIALGTDHVVRKYVGRTFAQEDLNRGWHGNRLGITAQQLWVRNASHLRRVSDIAGSKLDCSHPVDTHFWAW